MSSPQGSYMFSNIVVLLSSGVDVGAVDGVLGCVVWGDDDGDSWASLTNVLALLGTLPCSVSLALDR